MWVCDNEGDLINLSACVYVTIGSGGPGYQVRAGNWVSSSILREFKTKREAEKYRDGLYSELRSDSPAHLLKLWGKTNDVEGRVRSLEELAAMLKVEQEASNEMTETKLQEFWEGELTDTKTETGRDLDLRILGALGFPLKKVHYNDWDPEKEFPYYIPSGKPLRTHRIDSVPVPRFSTDPPAAMGLLQEVLKRGWQAQVWISDVWRCKFLRPRPYKIIDTDAATLPGAIALACKAALEADREREGEPK